MRRTRVAACVAIIAVSAALLLAPTSAFAQNATSASVETQATAQAPPAAAASSASSSARQATSGATSAQQAQATADTSSAKQAQTDATATPAKATATSKKAATSSSAKTTPATSSAPATKTAAATSTSANKAARSYCKKFIKRESKWLLSLQLDDGSFATAKPSDGKVDINPYFADLAAMALLDSDKTYSRQVKRYLNWHFAHLNSKGADANGVGGTIYDYRAIIKGRHVVKEKAVTAHGVKYYDSTDSYAATFLSLLRRYDTVTGDHAYLTAHKHDIDRIVKVVFATKNKGLTWATPSYREKILMDNTEVYRGLADAAALYRKRFAADTASYKRLSAGAQSVKNAINTKMWSAKGRHYAAALGASGKAEAFSWKTFYLDATSQLYPAINGVISPTSARAKSLYATFNAYWSTGAKHHRWTKIDTTYPEYWSMIAFAAAKSGDTASTMAFLRSYTKKANATSHAYPLTDLDAAMAVRAAWAVLGAARA